MTQQIDGMTASIDQGHKIIWNIKTKLKRKKKEYIAQFKFITNTAFLYLKKLSTFVIIVMIKLK